MSDYQQDMYLIILLFINILVLISFLLFNQSISLKLNLIDRVSNKKKILLHKIDTPNNGGIILFFFITLFYIIDKLFYNNNEFTLPLTFFFLFLLLGLFDDYLNIKPSVKIILYILIIYFFLKINPSFVVESFYLETFNAVVYLEQYSLPFTIFCIFFMLNILNMSDGINGSLISFCLPIFIILFLISYNFYYLFIIFSLIIILTYNLNGRLFLGNNGASLITAIVSACILYESKTSTYLLSAEKIFLLCAIPSFDLVRLFFVRIKNKKNPFHGDLNHFHHIVLKNLKFYIWVPLNVLTIVLFYFLSNYLYTNITILITLCIYSLLIISYKKNWID